MEDLTINTGVTFSPHVSGAADKCALDNTSTEGIFNSREKASGGEDII